MIGKGIVNLSRGPKQHRLRPAIDPLFRSAAQVYGQRVIGVLLSGFLEDGVEGLKEIKRRGGLAIVQDPAEAGFPEMPQNALAKVKVDHCLPVTKIRDLVLLRSAFLDMPMDEGRSLAASATLLTGLTSDRRRPAQNASL